MPSPPHFDWQNDIRSTGSASSGLGSEDLDITIVSLVSQASHTTTLPLFTTEDNSAAERTTKLVQKYLNTVAREKRRRHPPSDQPFRRFVISLGGMMETDARDALTLWKSIMTGGVYSLLLRPLLLGLLRARARCFEP
ncbi:hypothetical protein EHS25_005583 [Saitozyma podzolica]|jgi:hypothetical protein|uniref:Uncharacterized protein n=1 Tax=Saitozyma podzolica TaxID=1890683 RepID=A0A427XXV4_9TREE|nr:hypothetical protein EHS25_005583 [Saitozyma podzolica]